VDWDASDEEDSSPSAAAPLAHLVIVNDGSGHNSQKVFALHAGANKIGRADDAQVLIDSSATLSGCHACIESFGATWTIKDGVPGGKASSNGTFVRGARTSADTLQDGDQVKFGKVVAVFQLGPSPRLPAIAAAESSSSSSSSPGTPAAAPAMRASRTSPVGRKRMGGLLASSSEEEDEDEPPSTAAAAAAAAVAAVAAVAADSDGSETECSEDELVVVTAKAGPPSPVPAAGAAPAPSPAAARSQSPEVPTQVEAGGSGSDTEVDVEGGSGEDEGMAGADASPAVRFAAGSCGAPKPGAVPAAGDEDATQVYDFGDDLAGDDVGVDAVAAPAKPAAGASPAVRFAVGTSSAPSGAVAMAVADEDATQAYDFDDDLAGDDDDDDNGVAFVKAPAVAQTRVVADDAATQAYEMPDDDEEDAAVMTAPEAAAQTRVVADDAATQAYEMPDEDEDGEPTQGQPPARATPAPDDTATQAYEMPGSEVSDEGLTPAAGRASLSSDPPTVAKKAVLDDAVTQAYEMLPSDEESECNDEGETQAFFARPSAKPGGVPLGRVDEDATQAYVAHSHKHRDFTCACY